MKNSQYQKTAVSLHRNVHSQEAELATLEAQLVEAELSLATLRHQLTIFESTYQQTVGPLCEELDNLVLKIALTRAEQHQKHGSRTQSFDCNTPDSDRDLEDLLNKLEDRPPPESLQKLYREAARRFHPDFAEDEADREWRTQMMQRVNCAYAAGDSEALEAFLEQGQMRPAPSALLSSDYADTIHEKIARVQARLREILHEIREREASDIGLLYAQAKQFDGTIAEFFRDLAITIRVELHEKRQVLRDLLSGEDDEREKR